MNEIPSAGAHTYDTSHSDLDCDAYRKHSQGEGSIEARGVAARLNRLFDTIRPPGRGPLRNIEVLQALRARGFEMSAPYLSQLRSGTRNRPSRKTLSQLAEFFGISVEYLAGDDSAYSTYLEAELRWLETAHDPDARRIITALLALPADAREDILRAAQATPCVAD